MANDSVFLLTEESKPTSRMTHEAPRAANDQGIEALERLAFLREVLGTGSGDPLNLSSDARAGLAAMLGDIAVAVDEVTGAVSSCR